MGLFRLGARVGCWRGGAPRPLEEWPHSLARKSAMDRTRLTGPLAYRSARNGGAIFLSGSRMAKQKRSDDWGFPRWRSYGDKSRSAAKVRLCDREGCNEIGD